MEALDELLDTASGVRPRAPQGRKKPTKGAPRTATRAEPES